MARLDKLGVSRDQIDKAGDSFQQFNASAVREALARHQQRMLPTMQWKTWRETAGIILSLRIIRVDVRSFGFSVFRFDESISRSLDLLWLAIVSLYCLFL
jgi:hypothetical protein